MSRTLDGRAFDSMEGGRATPDEGSMGVSPRRWADTFAFVLRGESRRGGLW